jgi:hypothetical protein
MTRISSCLRIAFAAIACSLLLSLRATAGDAPQPAPAGGAAPDPRALLAQAKEATGGIAWDALRSQHTKVNIVNGPDKGQAERWASIMTGRSYMRIRMGQEDTILGYDGLNAWVADASGRVIVQRDPTVMELIVNAAYRDRLAFWYPERHGGKIEYARRDSAGGASYDVVRITPDGGRSYEVWINTASHLIERLREEERDELRTEVYSNFRSVQGVKLPFVVSVSHGDQGSGVERIFVDTLEYNISLDKIEFAPPMATPSR